MCSSGLFRLAELSVGSVGGFCLFSESLRFVFGLLVPRGVEARGLAADRAVAIAVMVVELEGLLENLGETAGFVGVGPLRRSLPRLPSKTPLRQKEQLRPLSAQIKKQKSRAP